MDKLDTMIEKVLIEEDLEIIESLGEEQGFFELAFGIFKGPQGWVSWVVMISQTILFIVGIYAAIQFFAATEVLGAIRWGIPGSLALMVSLTLKMALGPVMQTNRMLRALKRLELQIVRQK